jgi:hypothetical protein
MEKYILGIVIIFSFSTCGSQENEYLIKYYEGEYDELGVPSGYLNSKGDTIVPIGQYFYCYTDTIRNFGIVKEKNGGLIAINKYNKKLYDVFNYDNGPDYIVEGLFRIKVNEKIGYANDIGEIVIKPQFKCAFPFENGIAKVSETCEKRQVGEHSMWIGDYWFYIYKNGKRVNK